MNVPIERMQKKDRETLKALFPDGMEVSYENFLIARKNHVNLVDLAQRCLGIETKHWTNYKTQLYSFLGKPEYDEKEITLLIKAFAEKL
jgi:hypothetical protein